MTPEITTLYAVRHGETEWNVSGIQQGHLDSPLTTNGLRQAQSLAIGLSNRGIEYIYSSDLGRAAHTADVIASSLVLPVTRDPGLRERCLGSMQGLTQFGFQEQFPKEHAKYRTHDPDYAFPGGESARQRYDRSIAASNRIASNHPEKTVLIVTHGGVLNSLITYVLGLPINGKRCFSLYNGAINRFSIIDGVWHLDTWGDLSHLRELEALDDK